MTNNRPRARELGIIIGSMPTGELNAITDVPGVKVGHVTLIEGSGSHIPGKGPIRTGITVIFPHSGDTYLDRVAGALQWLNGFGECFGAAVVNEFGFIIGPIVLTNSFNVYRVADALQDWSISQHPEVGIETHGLICLVAECSDDFLNDIQGRHVHKEHVLEVLENAQEGPVEEGSVGAGTGTEGFGFKAGIGTSSRVLPEDLGGFIVGVLVLTNFGTREQLTIAGVPVGRELIDWQPQRLGRCNEGSCVITIATDAPLSSRQLNRLARRAWLGLARTGSISGNGSGDLAIAFSTTNRVPRDPQALLRSQQVIPDFQEGTMNALFQATVESVEEAILNSLFRADTMVGRNNNTLYGLPLKEVVDIMHKYGHSEVRYWETPPDPSSSTR